MSPERAMEVCAERAGWNESSQLQLCLEYIENQKDDATFEDFLKRKVEEEMGSGGP